MASAIETGPDGTVLRTAEWTKAYDGIPAIMAARAQVEAVALAEFLQARIAEFPDAERPTAAAGDLADDLRRRLRDAAHAQIAKPGAFIPVLAKPTAPGEFYGPDGSAGPFVTLPVDGGGATVDVHALEFSIFTAAMATVWPGVLEAWRDASRVVHLPGALMIGDGSLAPMFGRRFRARSGRPATPFEIQIPDREGAHVKRIVLHAERRQLSLWAPGVVRLVNPSGDEIVAELARVLDNGAWRMLLCAFAAAQEDARIGKAPTGAFLYTPARFADLHGIRPQSDGGARLRISRDQVAMLDGRLETLGAAGFEAKVSVGGKPFDVKADRLVYYAHTQITEGAEAPKARRGPGRRPALLYRLNDGLLRLLDAEGAWWFPLRTSALAAPDGVAQTTWDDALKVFVILCAKARAEAGAARSESGLPWSWSLDALLEQANIAGEHRTRGHTRETGRRLLGLLDRSGLLRHELVGEGEDARVRFDLPDQRPRLTGIAPRALANGRGSRRRG